MWQRKTKSAVFMSEFNDDLDWEEHDDFIHLNTMRLYTQAWAFAAKQIGYPEQDLLQFEQMIKASIEEFWGPCDCRFLRSDQRILVKSKDGKSMELVTGGYEPPPPIRAQREMLLH